MRVTHIIYNQLCQIMDNDRLVTPVQINYLRYILIHPLIIYIVQVLNHIMMELKICNTIFIKIVNLTHNILCKILTVYSTILLS